MVRGGERKRIVKEKLLADIQSLASNRYVCANGHPFTLGECGMPMQQTLCPQCQAPVGGQWHDPVAGVAVAEDLNREMRSMRLA